MVQRINGCLAFVYAIPQRQSTKLNFKLSLMIIVMGIFLLPSLAYLSDLTPERIIDLTNQERQTAGLTGLAQNRLLNQAAAAKAQDIFKTQIFSHTISDKRFSTWVRATGYNYSYVGENLAIDFATSEGVLEAWDNSPLHKKNLLSPYYHEIGVAMASGKFQGQDTTIVVQIFGAPATASVQPLSPGGELNLNFNLPRTDLANWQFSGAENYLTHSIVKQEIEPAGTKLILPFKNQAQLIVNKNIIQSGNILLIKSFLIIYALLSLVYFIIFLYYNNILKINKLILS